MARIFLSHSSANELEAVALLHWLTDSGWDDVFLDVAPNRGLVAGERWQEALRRAADRCEAVVFLVSPAWARSKWCLAEFLLARSLNKLIFGVVVEEVPIGELPTEMTSEWQLCDLTGPGATETIQFHHRDRHAEKAFLADGLNRLRSGLQSAGLSANAFPWPPRGDESRSPYRGLEPLDAQDAAVFFGRDAEILQGLDRLRGMRAAGNEGLLVILGASGAGKSSFLRAGLLPRLARDDRHFFPLPTVRPERRPLSGERGLAAALAKANRALKLAPVNPGDVLTTLLDNPDSVATMLRNIQQGAQARLLSTEGDSTPPTVVVPVDQAEELFSGDATPEAEAFLALIGHVMRAALDRDHNERRLPLIVVFTIRSDRFEPLQTAPALAALKTVIFDALRPMPAAQFKEVITGPATRASGRGRAVQFAPDLVRQLLADCAHGADTLPLLSLTLARLYERYGSDGDLRLDEYHRMGGMADVINSEAESVLASDTEARRRQLDLLHAAFIPWLATISADDDRPMRRVARLDDLPADSRPLIRALVDRRLLLSDAHGGESVIEVAHESLLRQWNILVEWLRVERDDLKEADRLEQAATAWARNGRKPDWLIEGERLGNAQALATKPSFRRRLEPMAPFLGASQDREARRRAEEARARQMELDAARERQAAAESLADERQRATLRAEADAARLRTRGRQLVGLLGVAAAVAVVAMWFAVQANRQSRLTERQFTQATALRVASEAQRRLSSDIGGEPVLALLMQLAAHRLAPHTEIEGAMSNSVLTFRYLEKIFDFDGHQFAFTPDGTRIVSLHRDQALRLWDPATGRMLGEPLRGPESFLWNIRFSPDGRRMVVGSGRTPWMWDVNSSRPTGVALRGHEDDVTQIDFTPDSRRIVSSSRDGTLRLWDAATGQPLGEPMKGHGRAVVSFAIASDGARIVSGGMDGTLRLWDSTSGHPIGAPMSERSLPIDLVAVSPDGNHVASAGGYAVRLWNASGRFIGELTTRHAMIGSVAHLLFSHDGTRILLTDSRRTMWQWNVNTLQEIGEPTHDDEVPLRQFAVHSMTVAPGWLNDAAVSPDRSRLVSSANSHTLLIWTAKTPFRAADFRNEEGVRVRVALSPDGKQFISAGDSPELIRWNTASGQPIGAPMAGHTRSVLALAFSPDGTRIVSSSADMTVRVWDSKTGQPLGSPMAGHTGPVTSVAFNPDGRRIVSGSEDKTIRSWDAASGKSIGAPITGHERAVSSVGFSPDGRRLVSGGLEGTVRLWDAATGQPIGSPMKAHDGGVLSVAFSPDGTRIVSAGVDRTLRQWDATSGQPIGAPMTGHGGEVLSVMFSPDGSRIVSGSRDKTVRFWDTATGRPIGAPMTDHNGLVDTVAFSLDGTFGISSSDDPLIRLWPSPTAWPDILCAKLTRNMSRKEWRESVSPDIEYREQCPGLPIPPNDPDRHEQ